MTNAELARLLHTTPTTLWRWQQKGSAPFCEKVAAQHLHEQGKLTIIPDYLKITGEEK